MNGPRFRGERGIKLTRGVLQSGVRGDYRVKGLGGWDTSGQIEVHIKGEDT